MLPSMQQLINLLEQAEVDALWVSRPENVRLLSGFTSPQDAKVLVTRNGSTLYTDARYTVQAEQECRIPHFIGRPPRTNAELEMYAHAAEQTQGQRVGFEADHLSYTAFNQLRHHLGTEPIPTSGVIEQLRLHKTQDALHAIREAQRIADEAYQEVLPTITAGRTEQDVALDLELAMRRRGAEGPAFEIIVASGERGAMPHGAASSKIIREGELVTIDMGARYDGYHSDMTRTIAIGSVSDELRRLYRAVLEAEMQCVTAVKPGVRTRELDALARSILARHDLAEYFAHSLGHGVGLAVHEAPSLSSTSNDVLESGMIITIEPGVYLPGVGGVRIEDILLVTDEGHEVLSTSPKADL